MRWDAHAGDKLLNEKGEFQTAPLDNLILPGIARAHLITACRELGIPVNETPFTVDEMLNAKEVLISSSFPLTVSDSDTYSCSEMYIGEETYLLLETGEVYLPNCTELTLGEGYTDVISAICNVTSQVNKSVCRRCGHIAAEVRVLVDVDGVGHNNDFIIFK